MENYNNLIIFLKKRGINTKYISMDSYIEKDLGITGDDAYEFIIAFSGAFKVDITNFKIEEYFRAEGGDVITEWFQNTFFSIKPKKAIQIKHLIESIKQGKLC